MAYLVPGTWLFTVLDIVSDVSINSRTSRIYRSERSAFCPPAASISLFVLLVLNFCFRCIYYRHRIGFLLLYPYRIEVDIRSISVTVPVGVHGGIGFSNFSLILSRLR